MSYESHEQRLLTQASSYEPGDLDAGDLAACDRDLAILVAEAMERFGAVALGAVELPRLSATSITRGELHGVATLYWASKVEKAGLPRFVEALAEQFVRGRLMTTSGTGGRLLMRYLRERDSRHSYEERRAIYSRLFGGPGESSPNEEFASHWTRLIRAMLPASRENVRVPRHLRAGIAAAAGALVGNLAPRSAGATRFDAERIIAHIREALEILRSAELRHLLGGSSPFEIVRWHSPHLLGESIEPGSLLLEARGGAELLRWVADHLYEIKTGTVSLAPGDSVLSSVHLLGVPE